MTALPGDMTSKSVPAAPVRAIILVGFMGAGKSSVGAALSRRLAWPFEDLDQRIQTREKRSIEEIFRQSGEIVFRQVEHAALRSLVEEMGASTSTRIVALGGGAFAQAENFALLHRSGFATVFLDAPVEELFRRCREQRDLDRPLRGGLQEFRKLYESRRPRYMEAGLRIETAGKDVEDVAAEAIANLGLDNCE
jgi:shikimate kinase